MAITWPTTLPAKALAISKTEDCNCHVTRPDWHKPASRLTGRQRYETDHIVLDDWGRSRRTLLVRHVDQACPSRLVVHATRTGNAPCIWPHYTVSSVCTGSRCEFQVISTGRVLLLEDSLCVCVRLTLIV